ncbi:uncharacterized protein LOC119110559 [Pollicipes pollicipes]|uniref:uncharacterized protein LOC119110559 n=1 Tax=Pollicipes pollicipes TaxID=41117 RepID=UPI0018851463|nr:uncharacterized protein LOC119110559 [Pollicipes pollicipes]XP_037090329.1 uncharacterized protein LOC119110559 [Pollicipes pollicipes]XP_037090330.1 uncharacterized protein LOC119110559 [Pollicipes pollicipes]XP_037090331.1 uncharacterized protein LOC119110559 [Pollicipes pollicipes]
MSIMHSIQQVILLFWIMTASICLSKKDRDCDVPDSYVDEDKLHTSEKCIQELNDLADAITQTTRCMAMAARPLSSCLSCYQTRRAVDLAYTRMMGPGPGQSWCAHELLDRDTTHVLLQAYAYYADLLALVRCDLCAPRGPDGSYALLPAVLPFVEADNRTRRCLTAANGSASACGSCSALYERQNVAAQAVIVDPDNWHTCRDVMDLANGTLTLWEALGCGARPLSWASLLGSLGFGGAMLALVVLFYAGVYWRMPRAAGLAPEPAAGRGARHLYSFSGLDRRPSTGATAAAATATATATATAGAGAR